MTNAPRRLRRRGALAAAAATLAAVLALPGAPAAAAAQSADAPAIRAGAVDADAVLPGDTLTLPLRIRAPSVPPGDSVRWALRWDPARLTLARVRSLSDGLRTDRADADRGVLRGALPAPGPTEAAVAAVAFRADGEAGPAAAVPDLRLPADPEEPAVATGIAVCVGRSGTLGDANDDGATDILDAQAVARRAAGLPVDPIAVHRRGDVDRDGRADVLDAQRIARHAVGLAAAGDFDAPAPGGCRAAEPAGRLVGTLVRANDGEPLGGVVVRLLRDGEEAARDTTTPTGDYVFGALAGGGYRVEPPGSGLPPVGGFRTQRAHRLRLLPGGTATSLDFGFRFLELAAALAPEAASAAVGDTLTVELHLRVEELGLPLATVRGRLSWPADRLEAAGPAAPGPGWSLQGGSREAGELTFAAVAADGVSGDAPTVLTLPVAVRAAGDAEVRPELAALEALVPSSGATVPLLGDVLLELRPARVEGGDGTGAP